MGILEIDSNAKLLMFISLWILVNYILIVGSVIISLEDIARAKNKLDVEKSQLCL
jgi:hypothetical protein